MILVVFAGPNGSGKSTIAKHYLEKNHIYYVCPDEYVKDYSHIEDKKERYQIAMAMAEEDRFTFLDAGVDFSFETVFSHKDKLHFLSKALENKYYIKVFFVTTGNPLANVERVQHRVDSGGHCVKEKDILNRYYRSMKMIPHIIDIAHEVSVYDNSETDGTPELIVFKNEHNDCYFFYNEHNSAIYEEMKKSITEKSCLKCHELSKNETKAYQSTMSLIFEE